MSIMSQDRMRHQMKTIGIETLTNYLQLDPFVLGNKRPITIYFFNIGIAGRIPIYFC